MKSRYWVRLNEAILGTTGGSAPAQPPLASLFPEESLWTISGMPNTRELGGGSWGVGRGRGLLDARERPLPLSHQRAVRGADNQLPTNQQTRPARRHSSIRPASPLPSPRLVCTTRPAPATYSGAARRVRVPARVFRFDN